MSEIGYIIDCSFELLESTPDVYESMDFALFNHGYNIEEKFNQNPRMDTIDIMSMVANETDILRKNHFSNMEKNIISLKTLSSFPAQYQFFKEQLLSTLIDSHIKIQYKLENPSLLSFVLDKKQHIIDIENEEDMMHPFIIYEAIQNDKNLLQWHNRVREKKLDIFSNIYDIDIKDTIQEYLHYQQNKIKHFNLENAIPIDAIDEKHKINKKDKKRTRNAIKRAINLFSSFFGEEKIKAFLNGHSFTIQGEFFNYIIKPSRTSIIEHTYAPFSGHIPYSLEIVDKNSNLVLGNLCVTIPKTPVIDQIIAIMLHLKTNEEEVLKTANLFRNRLSYDEIENEHFHRFFKRGSLNSSQEIIRNSELENYNDLKEIIRRNNQKKFSNTLDMLFEKDLDFPKALINHFNKPVFYMDDIIEQVRYNNIQFSKQTLCSLLEKSHE